MATTVEAAVRSHQDADPLDPALERAKTGDEDAFRDLVDAISPEFTQRLRRGLCADDDTASAVLQDAWMTSWTRLSSFASTTNLRQWIYRVATNNAISLLRRRHREHCVLAAIASGALPSALRDVTVDTTERDAPEGMLLRKAIDRLPKRHRALAVLAFVHGRRPKEIADLLGLPRSRINMRLHRVRGLLPRLLRAAAP